MIVLLTDTQGGVLDNMFVPLQHRLLFEGTQVHGAENLYRRFSSAEWGMIINLIRTLPTGTYSSFSWQREP